MNMVFKLLVPIIIWAFFQASFAASPHPIEAKQAMVVTTQHLATQVGINILKQGIAKWTGKIKSKTK